MTIKKIKIDSINSNQRLDKFLSAYFSLKREDVQKIIEQEQVLINSKTKIKSGYKLKDGDIVEIINNIDIKTNSYTTLKPYDFKLDIKFEDDDIIVLNKPKGILTHPTAHNKENTLANALLAHTNNLSSLDFERPGIVHRLDKNTAGLMIAAKNNESHKILQEQIKTKTLKRKYLAIVLGSFRDEKKEGIIEKPLVHYMKKNVKMTVLENTNNNEGRGLEAITKYRVLEEFDHAALLELELKTGRTHQIRVHLSSINHPVFGDSLYGAKSRLIPAYYNLKTQEQLLQSYYIGFNHPKNGAFMEFELKENDFSPDFIKVLNFLKAKNLKNEE